MIESVKRTFVFLRFFPVLIFYPIFRKNKLLRIDVERWISEKKEKSYITRIALLLSERREFRNLFIYRNRHPKAHRLFCKWIALWYPPEKTLFIECPDIGEGFVIQHGFATYIAAERIGKNFSVNQQVTIGYSSDGSCPTIGDNCMIMCGAKVLGNITLGDYTRVGANAVVIRDYERGHGLLVGVPAVPKRESNI